MPRISDRAEIKALQEKLYRKLKVARTDELPQGNAVYKVAVNQEGNILGYKPIGSLAKEFRTNTGLKDLVQSSGTDESIAEFKVAFTPESGIYVSPWE